MSAQGSDKPVRRMTVPRIKAMKGQEPVVALTAYTAPMARLLDKYVDILLVGDSMGMVLYGFDSTLPVTLDMMIAHGAAVVRSSRHALVIIDMPFGSYEESPSHAFRNAARAMKETGAQAIKLEGGERMARTIEFLVTNGIPVMAHIGLTPQSVNTLGGYKTQGREESGWATLIEDARAVSEAGAFATVIEAVAEPLAAKITKAVFNITIGIGASKACDGQVLVSEDMLGYAEWAPKFVKRYTELGPRIEAAAKEFASEVRARKFPGPEHTYALKKNS